MRCVFPLSRVGGEWWSGFVGGAEDSEGAGGAFVGQSLNDGVGEVLEVVFAEAAGGSGGLLFLGGLFAGGGAGEEDEGGAGLHFAGDGEGADAVEPEDAAVGEDEVEADFTDGGEVFDAVLGDLEFHVHAGFAHGVLDEFDVGEVVFQVEDAEFLFHVSVRVGSRLFFGAS